MDSFLRGAYDQAVEAFSKDLHSISPESCSSDERRRASVLLTNIAACELALDMSRLCLKSCQRAAELWPANLRSHILTGKAYMSLKKPLKALEVWNDALVQAQAPAIEGAGSTPHLGLRSVLDVGLLSELQSLISGVTVMIPISCDTHSSSGDVVCAENAGIAFGAARSTSITSSVSTALTAASTSGECVTLEERQHRNSAAIAELHRIYIGRGMAPSLIAMVRANLPCVSGWMHVDDIIACGYLLVNQRELETALQLYRSLLSLESRLPAALLGKGSAEATLGRFEDAVESFSAAIELDPTLSDAWKRRGQTRAAQGQLAAALADLDTALHLDGGSADSYRQRGEVYLQKKDYSTALVDFREAHARIGDNAELLNFIGMCEGQLGNIEASVAAHEAATEVNGNFKEAILNRAWMLKEAGQWEEAEKGILHAIRVGDSLLSAEGKSCARFCQAYSYMSLLQHGLGRPQQALANAQMAIPGQLLRSDVSGLELSAACHQALGQYRSAEAIYCSILAAQPVHHCGWQREVALYMWSRLDNPVNSFNRDVDVSPTIKDGWVAKRQYFPSSSCKAATAEPCCASFEDFEDAPTPPAALAAVELLERAARPLQRVVQLRCRGFLPNCRQHYMFGLAALQMAQAVGSHVSASAEASLTRTQGDLQDATGVAASRSGRVSFSWRELIDVAVLWRQVSEPNDPVWWIDLMPQKAFEEGFGLQTPIVNGQLKTCRYYCYYSQAVRRLVGELLATNGYYDVSGQYKSLLASGRRAVQTVQGAAVDSSVLETIRSAVGEDFYVVVPCRMSSGQVAEGTRLTLLRHEPNGFEFTIRTPSTPQRWMLFSEELSAVFTRITNRLSERCTHDSEPSPLLADALEFFYYFVTFAPLSRGTAVCGYAALCAVLRCGGYEISAPLPRDRQFDWEAILATDVDGFRATACPMLSLQRCSTCTELPSVALTFPTLRAMVQVLLRAK